ncbi:MAG: response regulator transcription factor [Flavobacteriales bacterium]|nr:response regulator transcription factor [Flavobacteriales bacterium]
MVQRLLLVEDEEGLQNVIKLNLELEGYFVSIANAGIEALKLFNENRYDLVILDVMLPELDGFSVCTTIRLKDQKTPILFLTAKDSSQDRITGLKIGGDDYLVKPFNLEELLLRVENLVKRSALEVVLADKFLFSNCSIDFSGYIAENARGEKRRLTDKEVKLLKLLIANKGNVVSRTEILETVWGYDVYPTTRTIDNFILSFRKFFESDSKKPNYFLSVRGVGYKFSS